MYRDVTVYRLVAGGSDERLSTLMADNSALHAEIPGLVQGRVPERLVTERVIHTLAACGNVSSVW